MVVVKWGGSAVDVVVGVGADVVDDVVEAFVAALVHGNGGRGQVGEELLAWERVGGEWCVRGRWAFSVRAEIEFGGVVLAQLRWCALRVREALGETGGWWQSVLSSTTENNGTVAWYRFPFR